MRLKIIGRYLVGRPRLVMRFRFQGEADSTRVMSDANWAGCGTTRKSTSGGCVFLGKHCVKSWSKTQHCISTSSAESEGITMIKAVSEGIGIARVLEEFDDEDKTVEVLADTNTALGIIEI